MRFSVMRRKKLSRLFAHNKKNAGKEV